MIMGDVPIRTAREDRLQRAPFAKEVAKAVLSYTGKESLVVGIYGPWGSGKSSVLNLIVEEISSLQASPDSRPVIVQFNPWNFADQHQLNEQFFHQLSTTILSRMPHQFKNLAKKVQEYGNNFSALGWVVEGSFPRVHKALQVGWRLLKRAAQEKELPELRRDIDAQLLEAGRKLAIVVDDIDRLSSVEVRQMFQLVKQNANFANTVYLLAFSWADVVAAIAKDAPGKGEDYLEKIIQIGFQLPPISETDLTRLIAEEFDSVYREIGAGEVDTHRFGNMFHSGFRSNFETLRDVKRYFNVLRFSMSLVGREVNAIDLAAIECIRVFSPDLYELIRDSKRLFAGSIDFATEQKGHQKLREELDLIFKAVPTERRDQLCELARWLFRKLDFAYENAKWGPSWEETWEKDRLITSDRYFDFYFRLCVPKGEISVSEMDAAIAASNQMSEFCEIARRYIADGRFSNFFDVLRHQWERLDEKQVLSILSAVFVVGDEVSTRSTDGYGIISDHVRLSWVVSDILIKLGDQRWARLKEAMEGKRAIYTLADIANMLILMRERKPEKFPDLSEAIVNEFKDIACRAICQVNEKGGLLEAPELPFLLYVWKNWGKGAEVETFIRNLVSDPVGAIKFVSRFKHEIRSSGLEDKVSRVRMSLNMKALSDLVDLDALAEGVARSTDSSLSDEERKLKQLFLNRMEKVKKGYSLESLEMHLD